MIVFRGTLGAIGILVDSVRGIVPAASGEVLEIAEDNTFHGCATGAIKVDADRIHLLSPAALLQANEHSILADFTILSRARLLQLAPGPFAEATD
jgi:chemotaxis signal transduction protein